jgi:predicted nucleic acid-binding protein
MPTSSPILRLNTARRYWMKTRFVFDAWALLALLQGEEPAASRVRQILEDAERGEAEVSLSIINLGKIYYRIGKAEGEREASSTLASIRRLAIATVSATDKMVFAAATLKMHHTMSYADAFAVATAEQLGATLVTGDPELVKLSYGVQIERLTRD